MMYKITVLPLQPHFCLCFDCVLLTQSCSSSQQLNINLSSFPSAHRSWKGQHKLAEFGFYFLNLLQLYKTEQPKVKG